jgi:small subunit ribosomal protein S7
MRGKQAPKRNIRPDSVYSSVSVTRFINVVLLHGKKSLAEKFVYGALESASTMLKKPALDILDTALSNVKPSLEVRSRRVGGANYQVPVPVDEHRQEALAFRWIVSAARKSKGKDFQSALLDELLSAYKGEGQAVKTKQDTERMAEANKAFAHFRW